MMLVPLLIMLYFHAKTTFSLKLVDERLIYKNVRARNLAVQGCISQCLELDKVQKECKFNTNSGFAVGENCTQTFEPSRKDNAILCSYPLEPVIKEFLSHPEVRICDFISVESNLRFDKPSEKFLSRSMDLYMADIAEAAKAANLKLVLKVGSWEDKFDYFSGNTFKRITNNAKTRADFITKIGALVENFKFHGVLLHWMYPGCFQAMCLPSSNVKDQELESDKIVLFTKELKEQANLKTLMILGSVINPNTLLALDPNQRDVMTSFKKTVDDPAIWRKIAFCVTAQVFSYTLVDPKKPVIGAKIANKDSPIYMTYADICRKVKVENYTVKTNFEFGQSFAYKDKEWFAFDDFRSMKELMNFYKQFGAGGLMVDSTWGEASPNSCDCPRYFYLRMVGELFKGGDCVYTPCL